MPLLYYWRGDIYRHDLDHGVGYHLNQASPLLHEIEIGDSLWAFTRTPQGRYALCADLIVSAKTRNSEGFPYGAYRVWGNLKLSRYFSVDSQADVTPLIQSLNIRTGGDVLGRSFQGRAAVRRISHNDSSALKAYSTTLPLEPRARLIPEERLEALLVSGDEEAVAQLLKNRPSGLAEERRDYLISQAGPTLRDRRLTAKLQEIYRGACQLCGWDPRSIYRADLCEGHHVRWLSRGGMDELANLVLVCPNHHRAIHRVDAPFDFGLQSFLFPTKSEHLAISLHELSA